MASDASAQRIAQWLAAHFGGEVVAISRQPRWRPVWFATVRAGGAEREVCVRGERTDTRLVFDLDHEMRFQNVAAELGLPVAAVHGWIDDPRAYVMDRVPGRADFAGVDEATRRTVVDEYIGALARLHAAPVEAFLAAGIEHAVSPAGSARYGLDKMRAIYVRQKEHPDPFLEWALGWVDRHQPDSGGRVAPVVWDSGQFHHHDGHFLTFMDFELAHLGDPMLDLAALRMRDSVIPFGDFDAFYDRYAELSGTEPDREAIERHHIAFTLSNELAFSHTLRADLPGTDLSTNFQWCTETNIYATEAIADYLGVELRDVEPPEPAPSRARVAHQNLVRTLRSARTDDPVLRYELRGAFRVAQHLARVDEIGAAVDAADLDDIAAVLGHRPVDWVSAQEELERFVLADRHLGAHDRELLVLFHRMNRRAQQLNGPLGSAMARHNPIQRFPRRAGRS